MIGDVEIGEGSSIWFQSVIRGDVHSIRIGNRTNIQDLTMIHVSSQESLRASPAIIGDDITVGHRVILHGCTLKNGCLIGMGAVVMDKVIIGENSIIGAGSIVTEKTEIPPGHLAHGSPAQVVRPLTEKEIQEMHLLPDHYFKLADIYRRQGIVSNG